ncbi:MAG TPA: hypothetical protein VMF69_12085 [Gemmataceae bacterium]|nr:hypothetical protein [Gemmataceae bacterium]
MTDSIAHDGVPIAYRTSAEIREQLADLAKLKAQAEQLGTADFASRIGMQSILEHEQALLKELCAAQQLELDCANEQLLSNRIKACEDRMNACEGAIEASRASEASRVSHWEKEHISGLMKACEEAIKRSRYVFILINIAGAIILAAQFNGLFSWLHNVTRRPDPAVGARATTTIGMGATPGIGGITAIMAADAPISENTKKRYAVEILQKDLYITNVPLIGIKFSSFDLNVIGSVALLVLAIWFYIAAQRENHVIKAIEALTENVTNSHKLAYFLDGIQHYFVLLPFTPHKWFVEWAIIGTMFMPLWVPFIIFTSDIMSLIDGNPSLWHTLMKKEQREVVIRIGIGFILACFSGYLIYRAWRLERKDNQQLLGNIKRRLEAQNVQGIVI